MLSILSAEISSFLLMLMVHMIRRISQSLWHQFKKDEADHVSASRLIGGSSELHGGFDECFRLMGSSFITACINWKFKVRLSESQNGFRAIKTDVIKQLDLKENITTIEQEMIMKNSQERF